MAEFTRVIRLKAKKVPKEGIHVERYPAAGPRELPDVLFKAAYDDNDGPVTTLLPAGRVALKAMDISLRPTNKKVRGIFATSNKATSAMVPANGMGGMNPGNPGIMGGMAGMMGMCGMPAASSMFGLMQWMKQQQEAMQSAGLNNPAAQVRHRHVPPIEVPLDGPCETHHVGKGEIGGPWRIVVDS